MKESLANLLVCPTCRKSLSLKISKKEENEIIEGVFICKNNHKFKVIRGIPRFVTDKAIDFVVTEDAFSSKWRKFNKPYHDKKWQDFQLKWLVERFDWKSLNNFKKFLATKKKNT